MLNKLYFSDFYFKEDYQIDNWKEKINSNEYLKAAIDVLNILDKNFPDSSSYLVGGVVRDLVMNKSFDDIDIATNVDIDKIEKIFKTYDIGQNKKFQIVAIKYKGFPFEIAHFRTEQGYSDHRRPDEVKPVKDFKSDAARRDISWNAMGVNKDGVVADHFGGIQDIQNKILKMVGNPFERFKEDSLRLMRVPRFASRFDFNIDPATIEAMKKNAPEIAKVSRERIYKELNKMAEGTGPQFARAIIMLKDTGILKEILPELVQQESMLHSPDHHPESLNVFGHVMEVLRVNKEPNALLNWCLLMHDLGKNKTYALTDKGTHSYHGHAEKSGKMVEEIGKRLKMDNDTISAIKWVAENHMKFFDILKMNNSTVATLVKSPYFDLLEKTAYCDNKSRGSLFDQKEWDDIQEKIKKVREVVKGKGVIDPIKKVINGALIMKLRPDIKQGIQFGKIIKDTIDYVLNNEININDMNAIENFIKDWK